MVTSQLSKFMVIIDKYMKKKNVNVFNSIINYFLCTFIRK